MLILHGGYFPCGFMDNYMPSGDVKSLYERECNEGRYKISDQKEYLNRTYRNQKICWVKLTAATEATEASLRL